MNDVTLRARTNVGSIEVDAMPKTPPAVALDRSMADITNPLFGEIGARTVSLSQHTTTIEDLTRSRHGLARSMVDHARSMVTHALSYGRLDSQQRSFQRTEGSR